MFPLKSIACSSQRILMQYQYLESGNMGKEFFLRKGSQLIIPSAIKIALKYANFSSLIKKIPSKGKVRSS